MGVVFLHFTVKIPTDFKKSVGIDSNFMKKSARKTLYSTSSLDVVLPVIGNFFVFSRIGLEDRTDLKEMLHRICFEDQNELGHIGGCSDKTPAVFELYSCAVDVANLAGICSFHLLGDIVNDAVFYGISTVRLDFGRNNIVREGFDDLGNGLFSVGKVLNELSRNEIASSKPYQSSPETKM